LDCGTYIEKYLSAHVDGELSPDELRAAEEHLTGCANCRARYAEERAVKALMRERAQMLRTPAMVRGSILAALDAADSAERARDRSQSIDRDGRRKSVLRRARLWIPVALAAAAMFAFVMLRGGIFLPPGESEWLVPRGPRPNDFHAKYILLSDGVDRSGTISFRTVVDLG